MDLKERHDFLMTSIETCSYLEKQYGEMKKLFEKDLREFEKFCFDYGLDLGGSKNVTNDG